MLTRRQALAAGPALAAAGYAAIFRAEADPLAYTLKPNSIAPGVWVISGVQEAITAGNGGAIANISILDSSEGAIVIDTGPSRRYGEQLAALAKELTGKPVVRAYITHFHPDHAFGNQAFDVKSLAAPKGVIDGLKELGDGFSNAMYRIAGDWMRGTEIVLPERAVTTGVDQIGNRRIRMIEMVGHTPSDLVLYEEETGLLFAGDLVFLDRAPTTPNADLGKWQESLKALAAIEHQKLVPGHGPVEQGARGIEQTADWLTTINEIIREAFNNGLDITEVNQLPLPRWTDRIALARYEFERSVMHLYPRLEAQALPRVDVPQ